MATAIDLMGISQPAELALRTGWTIFTVVTEDPGQGSEQLEGQGNKIVLASADQADDAVTLPADAGVGDEIIVYNNGTNSLDVFPATGHVLNHLTANQGIAVVASTSRHFTKLTATAWLVETVTAIAAT